MSRPQSSPAQDTVPLPLATSMLAAPFVAVAEVTHRNIEDWLNNSSLCKGLASLTYAIVTPIRNVLQNATFLHQALLTLHILCTMAIFAIATFASTERIALVIVASFFFLVVRAVAKPILFKPSIIDGLIALFFLTALLASLFSSYRHTSLIGMAKFSVFFMGYLNFRVLIGEAPKRLSWFLYLMVFLGFAESVIGVYQYIHHVQPLATWQDTSINPEDQLTRIFGTLQPSNPNLLAGFLIPCMAAGTGLALKNLFKGHWIKALPTAGMTAIILGALVLTGSRGGYLSIITMAVMTFLYLGHLLWHQPELKEKYRLKALWILVLAGTILAAVGGILVLPAIRNRFLSIFAMREDSSNSYRMNVWTSTIQMIKDNWLVGIGPGNNTFKQVYGLYMVPGYNALSAYSIFLEIWAEQGIFGLLLFFLLMITLFIKLCISFCSQMSTGNKIILGALLTGIIGSVIYGLFDTIWYRPSVNILFWLLVAGFAVYTEAPPVEEKVLLNAR